MPLALYLLALAVFAMGTSEFMLAGLVPDIAAGLDVPVGTAGLLTSAFAVGMVVGAPAMAVLTRRRPARATLLACVLIFAACHVVGALAPTFWLLFATRVVAALANAGFLAVALGTATGLVAPHRKGRALAVLLSGTTLAMVAGVPAGAVLGAALGWRAPFWAIALLCLPAALGVLRGLPDRSGEFPTTGVPLRSEIAQLSAPGLVPAMVLAALVNAGTFAALTYLAPIVTGPAGLPPIWVAPVLVCFGVGSFIGATVAGRLADRRPGPTITVGGLLLLLGWIALGVFATHPSALLTLVFLQGACAFAVGSTLITRVLYAAAGAPSLGGAYATAALNVGAAAGPALGAVALATPAGELGPVWVAAALTAVTVVVALPLLRVIAPRGDRAP